MQSQSDERDDITKLLRDAFVRICQLAIADCGVSAAELTLHLSIQINTGVPQVLSTTVVETVRSLSDRNRDHTESSASGGCEASEKSQHVSDNNSSCCRDENDLFDVDRSYGSSVHTDDAESWDFNRTVAARSLLSSCATESTFAAAAEGQFVSSPVVANDVHNLILSEDRRGEVPLNEFLADVEKSNDCDEYVISDSPVALLDIGKNKQEANKLYGNRHESLSTPGSSEDSLVAVSGACILSSMQHIGPHYADDLYSSNRQCNIGNTSFLQHCHFGEQDTMQSNSAVCGLTEVVRNTPAVDELSGSDATEIEAENSSLYSNTLDRSDRNDTSYEEDLIVDETDTHSDHTAATESSISRLCSPVSGHPACSEAAAVVKDVSHLKPYTATHLLSTVGTAQQPNVLSIGPNSYRLINLTADTQETEFQKIFSSLPTNIVAAIQDGNQDDLQTLKDYPCVDVGRSPVDEGRMKRFSCMQCDCSFSMRTNLHRHVKKAHCQPLWRPLPPVTGTTRREPKTPSKRAHVSSKDLSRYRHKCTVCPAVFTLRTNLTRHVRKVHSDSGTT